MADIRENAIVWITGEKTVVCDFTQRKYINKVLKLRDKQPELVTKFVQNNDGSIHCHLPLKILKMYMKTPNEQGVTEIESEDDEE